jgi:RNAse (barnase) inhibitor barstar
LAEAVRTIALDARGWRTRADFFAALLPELGAPDWVGGNLDALYDSLAGNNAVRGPYRVAIAHADAMPAELRAYVERAVPVFDDARAVFGEDVSLILA